MPLSNAYTHYQSQGNQNMHYMKPQSIAAAGRQAVNIHIRE